MAYDYLDVLATADVAAAQAANGSRDLWNSAAHERPSSVFTEAEAAFIGERDSFYLASLSQTGWPYVQHRGGPAGFLKVLDDRTLAFADFRGNRQYISLGNVAGDDRVSLILMDYPNCARLKVLAHMTAVDLAGDPQLAERLALPGYRGKPERAFVLRLVAFDWNCAQHITPRFTQAEIQAATEPLRARIAALEAENQALRHKPSETIG